MALSKDARRAVTETSDIQCSVVLAAANCGGDWLD